MGKILRVEIDPKGASFADSPEAEAWRLLQSVDADEVDSVLTGGGAIELRDTNGNVCGSVEIVEPEVPRRLRGHTMLIGGEMVTLWPVELAGPKTYPPKDCTEPLVWFHHAENDMSEPCDMCSAAMVNRWGWAYASCDVSEHVGILDNCIPLKRRDREALRDCGSANAEIYRK